jgi:23S rRNA (pseudouridine1915-N3)-methyltransferase
MRFRIVMIGKTQKGFLQEGEDVYLKRLTHYLKVEKIVIPDIKNASKKNKEQLKQEEGKALLDYLKDSGPFILLDEKGKQRSSENFANWIQSKMNQGGKHITFVIGGAYGFSKEVYDAASEKIALSDLTFSHQMIRLLFVEQLYRAFTILRNEPYHHQ